MANIRHLENYKMATISTKNHPILMKLDTQQQLRNSMTVTWPKMNFF